MFYYPFYIPSLWLCTCACILSHIWPEITLILYSLEASWLPYNFCPVHFSFFHLTHWIQMLDCHHVAQNFGFRRTWAATLLDVWLLGLGAHKSDKTPCLLFAMLLTLLLHKCSCHFLGSIFVIWYNILLFVLFFLMFSYSIFCNTPCATGHGGHWEDPECGNSVVPVIGSLLAMVHGWYSPCLFTCGNNAKIHS